MSGGPLLARVRDLWVGLTGVAISFPARPGVAVAVSPVSRLCPPGWVGIVRIGESAIATAPSAPDAELLGGALHLLAVPALTDRTGLAAVLPVAEVRGPASLAYLDRDSFRTPVPAAAVDRLPPGHPSLLALLAETIDADSDESGLAEITSAAFVVRHQGRVVAAAGWRRWPGEVAHLGVLTARQARGRRLGRTVAAAATADALDARLLPQWRARPESSRRIAAALGFHGVGAQISFRLERRRPRGTGVRR
jgi:hypothetical protein